MASKAAWKLRTARNLPLFTSHVAGEVLTGGAHMQPMGSYIDSSRTTACYASAPDVQLLEDRKHRESQLDKMKVNYCRVCGGKMHITVPGGEDELRHQCKNCGYIDYHNPKTVVGCLVEHEGKVLLCKRALEPCSGLWTLPAGYMELHESSSEGACRETWEEACARVKVIGPYAHLDIPVIGQSYLIFRAELAAPHTYAAGPESEEVALFAPEDIPFDSIAFSSISLTLRQWVEDKRRGAYSSMHGVIRKKPGASYRDPDAYKLTDVHHVEAGSSI